MKGLHGCNDKSSFTDIGGDGNCFFRCLSLYLLRDQKYFGKIRKEVVEFMSNDEKQTKAEKEKRYRQLIETQDEYDDYVKWVCHIEQQQNYEHQFVPLVIKIPSIFEKKRFFYFDQVSNKFVYLDEWFDENNHVIILLQFISY